jgi:hypothetical protein
MKYRVGPNVSFVHAGRVYTEGDEIDESAFKSEVVLKSLITAGKLAKPIPAPAPETGTPTPETGTPAAGTGTPAAGAGTPTPGSSDKGKGKK